MTAQPGLPYGEAPRNGIRTTLKEETAMLGHHISVGYNPRGDSEAHWLALLDQARRIADHPREIETEARRVGCADHDRLGESLEGYAENYRNVFGAPGHPVRIVEGEDRHVMQLASTDQGDIKYHVRRAFVRLLVEAMHSLSIEVTVISA